LVEKTFTNRYHRGNDSLPTNTSVAKDFVPTDKFVGQDLGANITNTNVAFG